MHSCLFFFSYARDHEGKLTDYQERFFSELVTAINSMKTELTREQIGFLDTEMRPGEIWPDRLKHALRTCQVFVYFQTGAYFIRPWCCKEWHVFRRRVDAYLNELPLGTECPPLMIPVLWDLPVKNPPKIVSEIQFTHRDLGETYTKEGVYYLMKSKDHEQEYIDLNRELAKRIIKVATDYPLPDLAQIPTFEDLPNAFETLPNAFEPPTNRPASETKGPRCAQFIYVVPKRSEIQSIRKMLDAYWEDTELEWRPYFPPTNRNAYNLAMLAAFELNLHYERVPFGDDLIDRLKKAKEDQKIVIIMLDSWSLMIPRIRTIMNNYGQMNFWNCAVVVPWNEDDETRTQALELQSLLETTFFGLPEETICARITSSDQFVNVLTTTLQERLASILKYAEFRKVEGRGPRQKPSL